MKRPTAMVAAGALVLTVAGGISTLAVIDKPAAVQPLAVIEYVDQAGNPVAPPDSALTPKAPTQSEPSVGPLAATASPAPAPGPAPERYQEDEHGEYEEHDLEETEDHQAYESEEEEEYEDHDDIA